MAKALVVAIVTCGLICFGVKLYQKLSQKNKILYILGELAGIR